jgi:hypothetical protein
MPQTWSIAIRTKKCHGHKNFAESLPVKKTRLIGIFIYFSCGNFPNATNLEYSNLEKRNFGHNKICLVTDYEKTDSLTFLFIYFEFIVTFQIPQTWSMAIKKMKILVI